MTEKPDDVTLRQHLEALIEAHDKRYREMFVAADQAVKTAMTAASTAVAKAEVASDKRFEGVNEFRATLADQQRTLMPRSEAEQRLGTLGDKLGHLEHKVEGIMAEKRGVVGGWGYAVGAVGLMLALYALFSRGAP